MQYQVSVQFERKGIELFCAAEQFIPNVTDDIHKTLTDTRLVEDGYDAGLDMCYTGSRNDCWMLQLKAIQQER